MRIMAPNHGYILTDASGEPVSRTYQYRKVMKPMLERKRRARINRCLDELKELMTGALQTEGENVAKLEKADILELTVRHLQQLRRQNQLGTRGDQSYAERFKAGFRHCAAEVTHFLGVMDQDTSIHVLKHLNGCINRLENTAGPQAANRSQQQQQQQQSQSDDNAKTPPISVTHGICPRPIPSQSVPPTAAAAAIWMQKSNRPVMLPAHPAQQHRPQPPQNYPNHGAPMQYRSREHAAAATAAAVAYNANRHHQLRQSPHDMHMMDSSTRINTPPMSPKIDVDDLPVWRPW